MRGSRTLAVHNCGKWQQKQRSGKQAILSVLCKDVKELTATVFLVAEDGSITVIRQVVDDRYNALTLTKLN